MSPSIASPVQRVCILRLSALGDVTHIVPLVYALRAAIPAIEITWICGPGEAKLLEGLPGVRLCVYRKNDGFSGMRKLWRELMDTEFDALLLMQLALRANVLSLGLRAKRRIGYDRARSKEGHTFFINERIAEHPRGHVLDTLAHFVEPLGIARPAVQIWSIPIPDDALSFAAQHLPDGERYLGISPCSSHTLRNWRAERYAAVADAAFERFGLRTVLLGGRSELEARMRDAILGAMHHRDQAIDLVGKDTLKQLLALLQRLTVLVAPDSGPVHIANTVGTPVVGLYAATDATRSGPYGNSQWCVNRYTEVAARFYNTTPERLPWGKRLEREGVMDLITVDDVLERLEAVATRS